MKCIAFSFLLVFVIFQSQGCYTVLQHTASSPSNNEKSQNTNGDQQTNLSIVEGTVGYSGGVNTRETHYMPGFILTNLNWLANPPPYDGVVYLVDSVNNSYMDKRVRIEGTYSVPSHTLKSPGASPDYTSEIFLHIKKLTVLE